MFQNTDLQNLSIFLDIGKTFILNFKVCGDLEKSLNR
jgi:hypothetical protein